LFIVVVAAAAAAAAAEATTAATFCRITDQIGLLNKSCGYGKRVFIRIVSTSY